jgi:hypothetical protein
VRCPHCGIDHKKWVKDKIAEAGLTEETEVKALAVIEFGKELTRL